jgi:hypothetical protein
MKGYFMKNVILKIAFLAMGFLAGNHSAFSQSCNRTASSTQDNDLHGKLGTNRGHEVHAPIDGGLGILIAAGIVYGIKRARDRRKKLSEPQEEDKIF